MHICWLCYRSTNNCKGNNHWNIIRYMNKDIKNWEPSNPKYRNLHIFLFKTNMFKMKPFQNSQMWPVDAWQCLTSGWHGPKYPSQINSLTCWMIQTTSQLLHSVHFIFWVVLILTQKILNCVSLSSLCSFPEHQILVGKYAKQVLSVTACGYLS